MSGWGAGVGGVGGGTGDDDIVDDMNGHSGNDSSASSPPFELLNNPASFPFPSASSTSPFPTPPLAGLAGLGLQGRGMLGRGRHSRPMQPASASLTAHQESADFDRFTDIVDGAGTADGTSGSAVGAQPVNSGTVQFDFRQGDMPAGVTVVGEGSLVPQQDRSTALSLQPGSYLQLTLPFQPNGAVRAMRLNDYSIVMDIKSTGSAAHPWGAEGAALYQTKWNVSTATGTEGEAYISKSGGVGTFGEYGESTTWLKPDRWQRIVLSMGGQWTNRRFTSYINAKPAVNINKGVFNTMDGRFSLTLNTVTLFASNKTVLMPGLLVRYVEVKSSTMSKEQVAEQASANKTFSWFEKEEQEEKRQRYQSLSLASLYKRPPPMYVHPAYLGQFGDAFLEGTGLDSGDVAPSIAVLSLVYSKLREEADVAGAMIGEREWAAVDHVSEVLKEAKEMSRRFTLAKKNPQQLIAFMKYFRTRLEGVKEGETLLIPAGIDAHPIILCVERVSASSYRLTVTNTHPLAGLSYHAVSPSSPPKLRYRTSLSVDNIPSSRMLDDAWWVMLLKLTVMQSKQNRPDKVYDWLLPWMADQPLDAVLASQTASEDGDDDWRSPQRAGTAYYKSITDTCVYMMRRRGVLKAQCKLVSFMVRLSMLAMVDNDLQYVAGLSESDRRVIQMGCQQIAYHAIKLNGSKQKGVSLSTQQLELIHERLSTIDALLLSQPSTDISSAAAPSSLLLHLPTPPHWSDHPLCDRLLRRDDVEGLAGLPTRLPPYVPVDVLQQPERARTFEEALAAIRHCDRECTRVAVQPHCVKNQAALIVSMISHTFTHIVPTPLSPPSPAYPTSLWSVGLRYALQLDILILLQRIVEHFAASVFSLQPSRSFDAVRVLIPAALLAVADAVLRKEATDIPSEVSVNLMGHPLGLLPYGINVGRLIEQSEVMVLHSPELAIVRTSVIDYFHGLHISESNLIFSWDKFLAPEQSTNSLISQICEQLAFPLNDAPLYLSGEQHLIHKNYPEFACYRDVAFYFKLMQNSEMEAFPPLAPWTQKHAQLRWKYDEGVYLVTAFQMELSCKPKQQAWGHRYPSPAVAGLLTAPQQAETEDDILHIKNLSTFDDSLGQRDSELLLSYLTVPYLRLPLMLTFFATEDRIHALRSEKLREVLDSVLFEPNRYLPAGVLSVPSLVPCNNPQLLSSAYGLLINELARSPDVAVSCTLRLLRLAVDLDVGTVRSTTVDIILYVVRLACRVDNYLSYLLGRQDDQYASVMRERELTGALRQVCEEGLMLLRRELRGVVHRMLEAWSDEAMKEIEKSIEAAIKRADDTKMDENTRLACTMHAHLVLIYRNLTLSAINENIASQLVSSYIFLTTRHTFNMSLLPVDEHSVFECLSVQRRLLIAYLHRCSQSSLNLVMEAAVRVSTGTGVRRVPPGGERQWGYVAGRLSIGRFAVVSSRHRSEGSVATVQEDSAHETIDLGLAQLTLRSSHLKALETAIAANEDVITIFGRQSMQAATLQSAEHREWVRLVGRNSDLQFWKSPDPRSEAQVFDREYAPGDVEASEQWIVPILEPVRLTYMTKPFELQIVMPELPLPRDAQVAVLAGLHPKKGGDWKLIYIYRQLRMVHVYNVCSHGRRFYQSLEYTSDVRFTLREMQPSIKDRQHAWPAWERHGAGHPYAEYPDPLSVVILRHADVADNVSGTEETFIPSRLLYGIVPSALLDTHHFWQDSKDQLRGYPTNGTAATASHILTVQFDERKEVEGLKAAGVVATIRRVPVRREKQPETAGRRDGEKEREKDEQKSKEMADRAEQKEEDVEADPSQQQKTLEEEELLLVNLLYAAPDTRLASLAHTITRVENLSYVLAWTKVSMLEERRQRGGEVVIDLLELPRLKLNFQSWLDEKGVMRMYSMDHVTLFISNDRSTLINKLITGLPHSLLLANANGEVNILVPSIHPVRPVIGTAPFSTELVLFRNHKEFAAAVNDNTYHLYPVHVSLSFMFTPSLSSALYLLLLRFLHRDYSEVYRLSNSIATDTALSKEEAAIFELLKHNNDCHPDAHACRMKISHVTLDSPMQPGWDLTQEMSRYITKLSHVSAQCRLSHRDEQQLIGGCILSLSDPRYDPETMYEYFITLVANRAFYLSALLASRSECAVCVPGRSVGGKWVYHNDLSYMAATAMDWQSLTVQYSASPVLSGVIALDVAHQFWPGMEVLSGVVLKLGFLFLYNMFTGQIKMKVHSSDDTHTFATLLLQLYMDAHDPGLLPSILHTMARNPALCATLPKYKDRRQYKHETVSGWAEEGNPSPLDDLFVELVPQLQSMSAFIRHPPESYPRPAAPPSTCIVKPVLGREWIIPALSDFSCEERTLHPVDGAALGDDRLTLTQQQLDVLSTRPLSVLLIDEYVMFQSRDERGLSAVSDAMPFDVSGHPQAKSDVAKSMSARLQADMRTFAKQENGGKTAKLVRMLDSDVRRYVQSNDTSALDGVETHIRTLLSALEKVRDEDNQYVSGALPWLIAQSNSVSTEQQASTESAQEDDTGTADRFRFLLRRYAGQESHLWLETVFAALLSSRCEEDLKRVNPYLTATDIELMMDVAVAAILRANRVGQANRAITDGHDLLHLIHQAKQYAAASTASPVSAAAVMAGLTQKSEMLARQLVTGRHYVDKAADGRSVYDPRFLVFEFTWNLCLRAMQVQLVRDFMSNVRSGRSMVKGMLMGEGKTTVVGPLLALMLADGKRLVVQAQPAALLEFSRSILRSSFSSLMYKKIYTLTMERSSVVDDALFNKLVNARDSSGIVISTPTALKSIQLKYIELLNLLDGVRHGVKEKHDEMVTEAHQLHRTLQLFRQSVLILDECDLILHPLKSELNFPIGAKEELDFAPNRWKLPIHLLDAVFFAERGRMSVGFQDSNRAHSILAALAAVINDGYRQRALQRNPHIVLLNTAFYFARMQPVLMDWLLLWLESQHLSGLSEEQIKRYVLQPAAITSADEMLVAAVSQLAPKLNKMLNLSRDWLCSYLPHVLAKIDRVSFGLLNKDDLARAKQLDPLMPASRTVLAVPFVGKDVPSRSSEFAHPDVIIGLTILAYRYEGLRETDFHDIIASLRATLTKEIGPYAQRKSALRYNWWVREAGGRIRGQATYKDDDQASEGQQAGEKKARKVSSSIPEEERVEVVALRLLKRSNEDQMRALYDLLRHLPDLIHFYLLEFIFPAAMRHQIVKLQASGQDIGGDMLFPVRVAFSGTPSTLLPFELGEAQFQPGSDGLILHTLTSEDIVRVQRVNEGWSVRGLLDAIVSSHVHALIDTGALITGMSNLDVARYLLDRLDHSFAGVVFLDELDRKMILVRATGHVVPLATSGIPVESRFAFYDQIHTTGMDIQHRLNACAVLTLGKDMVFRDYAQGAYRMRGISKGQTIQLLLIPEIVDVISRELTAADVRATVGQGGSGQRVLVEVVAWLVVNSMRSERVQSNMLALQNLANTWRKAGFRQLMEHVDQMTAMEKGALLPSVLSRSLSMFSEPIEFTVESGVKAVRLFSDTIDSAIERHADWIVTEADQLVVQRVRKAVEGVLDDDAASSFDREMTQEQEQEREQEQEQEQGPTAQHKQEIEVEKYVDLAYSRDHEAPVPWPFASLSQPFNLASNTLPQPYVYPLSAFHLYKRQALPFPAYLYLTNNLFNPQWTGARRIKNTVIVMELLPNTATVAPLTPTVVPLSAKEQIAVKGAIDLFHRQSSTTGLSADDLSSLIRAAMDFEPTVAQVAAVMRSISGGEPFNESHVASLLQSNEFRDEQQGRFYVSVSLAEAETIRRILHLRLEQPVVEGAQVAIALRCLPSDHSIIDQSHGYLSPPQYQSFTAQQSFHFFDGTFHYTDAAINTLLRALQLTTTRQRQSFFTHVIGCRRRMTRRWEETPLAKLFTIPSAYHMLLQRAQSARLRTEIAAKGILQYDMFRSADFDRNGLLTAAELWGALDWLGVEVSAEDVVGLVLTFDSDGDRNLNYNEFVSMLLDPLAPPDAREREAEGGGETAEPAAAAAHGAQQSTFTRIQPKGEAEIEVVMADMRAEEKRIEEEEMRSEKEEEAKIASEIRQEEEEADRKQQGGPNPLIDTDSIRYDLSSGRRPRLLAVKGDIAHKGEGSRRHTKLFKSTSLILPILDSATARRQQQPASGVRLSDTWSATLEIRIDSAATAIVPLLSTVDGRIVLRPDGAVGFDSTFLTEAGGPRLRKDAWSILSVSVAAGDKDGVLHIYLDGRLTCVVRNEALRKGACRLSLPSEVTIGGEGADVSLKSALVLIHSPLTAAEVQQLVESIQAQGSWVCPSCTSINTGGSGRCVVCGTARAEDGVVVDAWECPVCTVLNPRSATVCTVCETPIS